jgi:hypothetical protein
MKPSEPRTLRERVTNVLNEKMEQNQLLGVKAIDQIQDKHLLFEIQ